MSSFPPHFSFIGKGIFSFQLCSWLMKIFSRISIKAKVLMGCLLGSKLSLIHKSVVHQIRRLGCNPNQLFSIDLAAVQPQAKVTNMSPPWGGLLDCLSTTGWNMCHTVCAGKLVRILSLERQWLCLSISFNWPGSKYGSKNHTRLFLFSWQPCASQMGP